MTSYSTTGAYDSHWQTPPPDSNTAFFDAGAPSYDSELLDVFQSDPFRAYPNTQQDTQNTFVTGNQRVPSGNDGSMPSYSDAASSPQGSLSYASSTGYSTGNTSFGGAGMDFDLNSLFTAPNGGGTSVDGDSPPFDFGNSLACDFDTSGLQALFSPQASLPHPQTQYQQTLQGLSPSSTMSGNSPPNSYPLWANYHFQPQQHATAPQSHPGYPAQYLSSGQSTGATYPTPARNPSISSGASPASSYAPGSGAEANIIASKRRRVTLAETAGLAQQRLPPSSSVAPAAFTVKADSYAQLGGNGSNQPQSGSARRQKAKSPVELIANAGMTNSTVYNPPVYQLLPKPVNVSATTIKGKKSAGPVSAVSTAAEDKAGAGAKRKKPAERGHNAVEQKYRNSINNALATLRDTIPALRHLKPLPSMPVSKRKASQFSLPSNVAMPTPDGLVDGVAAAKTLSKGVILNKAIEYIDYLRFARESHNEDLEMLKDMVRTMVGGGEQLVAEFEKKREEREAERIKERESEREEGADEDDDGEGDGEAEEEEEEDKPAPAVSKTKKTSAAPKKRGAPKKDAAPITTKPMAATQDSTMSLPSQQISPPLTSEYRHIQALNAAHLESLAAAAQPHPVTHTFPPSPVSSDDHAVSPAALTGDLSQYQQYGAQPPRVLLASFMGLSFAGGVGYDWTSGSAAAAAEASELVGSAWTSRLTRRAVVDAGQGGLVDLVHPSLVSGLVALGLASIAVSLLFVIYPLLRSPRQPKTDSRRSQALSSLAAGSSDSTSPTYSASRANALTARKDLLRLVNAPSSISLLPSIVKEACKWALDSQFGLHWSSPTGRSPSERAVERAVAWVRIAEIEATVGNELSYFSRLYTLLHLSNSARSSDWPQVGASTSPAAVTALLATHLLSCGHARWAESLWLSIPGLRKKSDSSTSTSDHFVEVALDADFDVVRSLLDPSLGSVRSDDEPSTPQDTVPLLQIAESVCMDALEDVWTRIFTTIVDSTCPPYLSDVVPSKEKLDSLIKNEDLEETLEIVYQASVAGSEVRSLALMTRAILETFSASQEDKSRSTVKACIGSLLSEAKQGGPFARFASSAPFCQLLLPSLPGDLVASFPHIDEAINTVDHLAATTLSWLVLRRQSLEFLSERAAYPSPPPSPNSSVPTFDKVHLATHAEALAVRRLLAHDLFRTLGRTEASFDEGSIDFDEAKDLLVDALTILARRAAGLGSRDEDSGVEL